MQTARDWQPLGGRRPLFMVAGPGRPHRAGGARSRHRARPRLPRRPAEPGGDEGRERGRTDRALPARWREVMPLVGFYLQPAVGGIELPARFWRRFAAIDNVVAIKMAPFNRYRTLDVIRGVVAAGAEDRVTLYTGNDDHIVLDLLAPFTFMRDGDAGHRAHPRRPARPLERVDAARGRAAARASTPRSTRGADRRRTLLALDAQVTDCNARAVRRGARLPRLHRRLPRGAAPPGPARRHLVPGSRTKA